jgi:molecular chaperone Hsp33
MLMRKSCDLLVSGADRGNGLRWTYVDVTDSATALARSHLAGPAATLALAESITAVALLGADLETPEETVSLQMKTDGPIGSALVEAAFDGSLRGFTAKKIIPEFDGDPEPHAQDIFGAMGDVQIIRSTPGHIISQSGFRVSSPRPGEAITQYFGVALQRRGVAALAVAPDDSDGVSVARGFFLELMPEGNEERYAYAKAMLGDGPFSDALDAATGAEALCEELGMGQITADPARPLRFACRCSRDRARETLKTLSKEELLDMAKAGHDTDIYCHMCGKCHSFKPAEIEEIARSMQ